MRFVLFFTIFMIILSGAGYVAYLAPYHIYTLAITEGIKTDFIETTPLPMELLKGGAYNMDDIESKPLNESEKLWPIFHFTNFKIPFPVHHPLYNLIPVIEKNKNSTDLGVNITDRKDESIGKILVREPKQFNLELGKYKLFNLTIYKKMILDKKIDEIWNDLFLKDITLPNYEKLGLIQYTKVIKKYKYEELVYNLFLLKLRSEIFPKDSVKIGMLKDKNIGIVELDHEEKKYSRELFYIKTNSKLRVLDTVTAKYKDIGKFYRKKILEKVKFKNSDKDSGVHLYTEFRELDYKKKIDQEGMIYLYSAWTHNFNEKKYLEQLIQWLERGKGNGKQLIPLYNYAKQVYGQSFSDEMKRREDAQKKLERKIEEEIEDEIDQVKNENEITNVDGNFESEKKQIEFFLKKAKESEENVDQEEDILVVD